MKPEARPPSLVQALQTASNNTIRPLISPPADSKEARFLSQTSFLKHPRTAILPQRSNDSLASSTSTLMPEKRVCQLPLKRHGRLWRNLRYTFFSVYRRLFALVLLANFAAFVYLMSTYRSFFAIPLSKFATATSANIFMAVLMRQELTINFLFTIFGWCPKSVPLRIRRMFAKIYHFGGIHSGCGVSCTLWFTLFHIAIVRSTMNSPSPLQTQQQVVLAMTAAIDLLLVGIVITAYPRLRYLFHNLFERIHRFAGWSAILMFWVQLVILADIERNQVQPIVPLSSVLMVNPSFWLLIAVSIFIIAPWLQLKQVDVHPEYLSEHAIRLHFTYTNLALCSAPRFTDRPLHEWHAFAGIPSRSGQGFSIVVSNAGDWTQRMIQDPPTHLWTRGFPTKGVLNIAQIFQSVVLVATGSGIGPILALITARNISCRIVWSTPTPEIYYQQSIVDDVYEADPNAIIIDTTRFGRPDLIRVAYEAYTDFQAEAVFIISNPKVTRKVVYGLETRGVPIFAPIFDS